MPALPVYLVRGDQPVLLADAVKHLVGELAGGGDAGGQLLSLIHI